MSISTLLKIASIAAILFFPLAARATSTCPQFPASTLRLFSAQPITGEYAITHSEMDRIANRLGVSQTERAIHPLMLMTAEIDAHIAIQNRTVEFHNGNGLAYCDTPTSVVVTFGVVERKVFFLQEAASDPCVHRALLDHYAEHRRALDDETEPFIRQYRDNIGTRIQELNETASPDPVVANGELERGLWSIIRDVIDQFKIEIKNPQQIAGQQIDSAAQINRLRNACGGKLHQMERELAAPESKAAFR
jgi:hypothetical protein